MKKQSEEFDDEGEELIAEVRAARHRISERFGHDPYKLVAYYMERQKTSCARLIRAAQEEPTERSAA